MTRVAMPRTPIADAVECLKNVFSEIPGTQLSLDDASRLSGLEPEQCRPLPGDSPPRGVSELQPRRRFRQPLS